MLFDISGKNALITGASRGIGYKIAEGYAEAGANLILISRNMSEETLNKLRSYGTQVDPYPYDLANCAGIPRLISDIVGKWDVIDILVNAAGVQRRKDSVDFSDDDWDYVCNVNAKSVFIMCREIGRCMIRNNGGKIINFASLMSYQGGYRIPAYTASKGAVTQFTKTLSNEWAKHRINVNCIAPGYIHTDMCPIW